VENFLDACSGLDSRGLFETDPSPVQEENDDSDSDDEWESDDIAPHVDSNDGRQLVKIGSRLAVYCSLDDVDYHGTVVDYNSSSKKPYKVAYNNQAVEWLDFGNERPPMYRFLPPLPSTIPEPMKCTLDECLQNFESKAKFEEAMKAAPTEADKDKLEVLKVKLHVIIKEVHNYIINHFKWCPQKLTRVAGIYALAVDFHGELVKIGQSTYDCVMRGGEQPHKMSALIMTLEELNEFISPALYKISLIFNCGALLAIQTTSDTSRK